MADIKKTLTENIEEALRIDQQMYKDGPHIQPFPNGSDRETDESSSTFSPIEMENNMEPAKKKRFSKFRKVVSGMKGGRKKKHDMGKEKEVTIGDGETSGKFSKSARFFRKNKTSSSTISRMWNSLFPNKENTMSVEGEKDLKGRSTKTIGRLFGIRQSTKTPVDKNDLFVETPKWNTLGRRITEGLGFRNVKSRADLSREKIAPQIMLPTNSLKNKTPPIPI